MIRIKICGMKQPENIWEIAALRPDYMGMIFYEKSPRCALDLSPEELHLLLPETCLVGVFVNETLLDIRKIAAKYRLTTLQLHGSESPEECKNLEEEGYTIIKAFPIAMAADFETIKTYENACSYTLLDTRCSSKEVNPPLMGGTGRSFDWKLLRYYTARLPFFLSGGISPESVTDILRIDHPMFYAVDINSRFEISPGIKASKQIESFLEALRNN
ncbi:MAG: phosphoribosylanthranilate isomerase [Rikenellaceae bacterium]